MLNSAPDEAASTLSTSAPAMPPLPVTWPEFAGLHPFAPVEQTRGYQALIAEGTQQNVIDIMQTRADLYEYLDYHSYEHKLDALFSEEDE